MKAINPAAKRRIGILMQLAHVKTDGVQVAVLKLRVPECFANGRVNLPECLFDADMRDQLGRTWRHELQHARDVLDGIDLPTDEMERRARAAEKVWSCPECGDTHRTCEHVCYKCDAICPDGTYVNGLCDKCWKKSYEVL